MNLKWNESDKNLHYRRSDMQNLIYYMTEEQKFGLQTNGNVDAILVSLPPRTGGKNCKAKLIHWFFRVENYSQSTTFFVFNQNISNFFPSLNQHY